MLQRFLDGQDRPKDVGVEFTMEFLFGDRFERLELKDSSVVHQHLHRAEDFLRFFEHAFHIGRLGDVSLDRDRLATSAGNLRHCALRSLFA